jgi:site-specific DNA-methyltransferase (adenine-specific)
MQSNSIDLIIADPPFGIKHSKEIGSYNREDLTINGYIEIDEEEYDAFTDQWIAEASNVLKKSGSMYIVSGWNRLEDILKAIRWNNLHLINHIIWRYSFGVYTKRKYVTSHYHILFVVKDKRHYIFNREARYSDDHVLHGKKMNYYDREDVWNIPRENWSGRIKTKNKLPKELVKKMMLYSSNEKDIVLDPFMGSGQVPYVAKELNRFYIGIEKSENPFNFAEHRVENLDYYAEKYEPKGVKYV